MVRGSGWWRVATIALLLLVIVESSSWMNHRPVHAATVTAVSATQPEPESIPHHQPLLTDFDSDTTSPSTADSDLPAHPRSALKRASEPASQSTTASTSTSLLHRRVIAARSTSNKQINQQGEKPQPYSSSSQSTHIETTARIASSFHSSSTHSSSMHGVHPPHAALPSVSLPSVGASEAAVRLLLHDESHMAEFAPYFIIEFLRFVFYAILTMVFALWWVQGGLLYVPNFGRPNEPKQTIKNTKGFRSPSEYGMPFEELWIDSSDGVKLHAWLIFCKQQMAAVGHMGRTSNAAAVAPSSPSPPASPASSSPATMIFFHGNAGNIGYRLPNAKALAAHLNMNVLLVDYRGYGQSSGEPTQQGLEDDAIAVLRHLRVVRPNEIAMEEARLAAAHPSSFPKSVPPPRPRIDLSRIYLFGRSLGGAVALHAAYRDQTWQDQQAARRQSWNAARQGANEEERRWMDDARQRQRTSPTSSSSSSNQLPSYPPLAGVIVENSFTSIREMVLVLAQRIGILASPTPSSSSSSAAASSTPGASSYGLCGSVDGSFGLMWRLFIHCMVLNPWLSINLVPRLRVPCLFVSGLSDELIPPAHMSRLYAAAHCSSLRRLHTVEDGTHNDTHIRGGMRYFDTLATFIAETTPSQADKRRNDEDNKSDSEQSNERERMPPGIAIG